MRGSAGARGLLATKQLMNDAGAQPSLLVHISDPIAPWDPQTNMSCNGLLCLSSSGQEILHCVSPLALTILLAGACEGLHRAFSDRVAADDAGAQPFLLVHITDPIAPWNPQITCFATAYCAFPHLDKKYHMRLTFGPNDPPCQSSMF